MSNQMYDDGLQDGDPNLFASGPEPKKVLEFQGEHRFLSNFFPSEITHDGITYPTVEHAFQAAKTLDFHERWKIAHLKTPGQAKRAGRELTLRPDWDVVKRPIMLELVTLKYVRHRILRCHLLATGNAELIEGNTWGDTYWGKCRGKGENHLGKLTMLVRSQLR
jgi:N-glycosidase YbiA